MKLEPAQWQIKHDGKSIIVKGRSTHISFRVAEELAETVRQSEFKGAKSLEVEAANGNIYIIRYDRE